MPTKTLATTHYQKLLKEIGEIYETSQMELAAAGNQIRLKAYWQIGRRIVVVEQENQLRADYGERLLENISEDLSAKYGKGFSVTNLRYIRQFYLTHQIHHPGDELDWIKYRELLKIKDDQTRERYEKKAAKEGWSRRELQQALKEDEVEIDTSLVSDGNGQSEEAAEQSSALATVRKLPVQRGRLYAYKIVESSFLHSNSRESLVALDLGFNLRTTVVTIGKNFNVGDWVDSTQTKDGYRLRSSEAAVSQRFTYKAFVERVVDGDTLLVHVDCGFDMWARQRLRLRHLDAPELKTAKGQKAKAFVEETLKPTQFLVIKTYHTDLYDRYLADIFYLPHEPDADKVVSEGQLLNQDLLDQNLAVRM